MTRATTWTNADGLVVGFGRNYAERQAGSVVKTEGDTKQAVLNVTYESTFGESGALIQLPKNVRVTDIYFEVTTPWASSDSGTLSVGHTEADTADVDAFFTTTALAAAALTPAGKKIAGDGVYIKADTDTTALQIPAVLTDDYDDSTIGVKVFLTKANNFTAGEGRLVVQYS